MLNFSFPLSSPVAVAAGVLVLSSVTVTALELPLTPGTYVEIGTSCSDPSHATSVLYVDGSFGFPKTATEMNVLSKEGQTFRVSVSMIDLQGGSSAPSVDEWVVVVNSPTAVTIENQTYRLCTLPLTSEPWHPSFATLSENAIVIDKANPRPAGLEDAQECMAFYVMIAEHGTAFLDQENDEVCRDHGLGYKGNYLTTPTSPAVEVVPGYDHTPEAFYQPRAENIVLPTLRQAQDCLAYMVWRAETGEHYTPTDKFCALRGLYLSRIDLIN